MSKILNTFLIIIIAGTFGYSWYKYNQTPCDQVLYYSIGRFDKNFGITEEQFKSYISSAEKPWENYLHKNLFEYKADAKFTVNLVYDQRQRDTITKQMTESGLNAAKEFFRTIDSKYNSMKRDYENKSTSYDVQVKNYESKQSEYQQEVAMWNSRGGAPQNKFTELESQRVALNQEASYLNSQLKQINQLAEALNTLVKERNKAAEEYNNTVADYNKKFGGYAEFDQADYRGNSINVYQFDNSRGLIMALSHEFGHALEMDHVDNPKSIMYYLRDSDLVVDNPVPSPEDIGELKMACRL